MLCGAPSWLSKAMVNGLPAGALTAGVVIFTDLATTETASPDGLPAGAAGVAGLAEAPEQAARVAASASRPRVRVRRFMAGSPGQTWWAGLGAGGDGAAATDERGEGGELATDD